ncbi:MAG: DUF5916 domain-containing protein [Cyclobacteriaceae bacterium]
MQRLFLLLLLSQSLHLLAQHSQPDTIKAFLSDEINFDGNLTEPAWSQATHISNFTQRELDFGQPATEHTEVAVVYTDLALYIGVWAYQKDPKSIVAKFLQRDFDFDTDDNFKVILSPFNDRRNGYEFVINPLGARADLLVSGNESSNIDWNGVWDAKTTINDEGWFAEIVIPFTSLKFKKNDQHIWAINFERNIRSKNEQARWQGWSRDFNFESIVNAGTLSGIEDIGYSIRFEFKPYGLSGYDDTKQTNTDYTNKLGADLNVNITPTLKLNLTTNTDFAQVEADRIPVNLTRFSVFYPEKREFFLEGSQNYEFAFGNDNSAFYTRTIGLENRQTVPVIAGLRLFGKEGRSNIGFLSIQSASKDTVPSINHTVLRYRHDMGKQSNLGFITTSKISSDRSNQVTGADATYNTSEFLKNKNLIVYANFAHSFTSYKDESVQNPDGNGYAYRVFVDYPNDAMDLFASIGEVTSDFNAESGFVNRDNYRQYRFNFRLTPRWLTAYGIRKMNLKPWGIDYYETLSTGQMESFFNESRPVGFFFKSGEFFEYNLVQQYDRPDDAFDLTTSITIPSGKYWMYRQQFQFGTFQGRRLWSTYKYAWGGYYTGHIKTFDTEVGINLGRHLNLSTLYTFNSIRLPEGSVDTNELAQFINYAFTTKLSLSYFIQWNSVEDYLAGNFRLHWIPKVGTDFFFVLNQSYNDTGNLNLRTPNTNTGVAKLVWRIVF